MTSRVDLRFIHEMQQIESFLAFYFIFANRNLEKKES